MAVRLSSTANSRRSLPGLSGEPWYWNSGDVGSFVCERQSHGSRYLRGRIPSPLEHRTTERCNHQFCGAARSGDVSVARRSVDEIASIRKAIPATRDYDWSGSIGAQWEAATALIAWAEGKKDEGLRLLRMAADHEDAVDKHPVTPGALLPVREMLADLLLENGSAPEALKDYEAVLKTSPRRLNATAGAAKAADKAGDKTKARAYAMQLREIAHNAETSRPELEWARVYLGSK